MGRPIYVDNPPDRLKLSPVPNIKQPAEAVRWIAESLGIEVTERYIVDKTKQGKIEYSIIGGKRHYSSQALYAFILSCNKTGGASAEPAKAPWQI